MSNPVVSVGEGTNPEETHRNVRETILTPGWRTIVEAIKAQADELVLQRSTLNVSKGAAWVGEEYIRLTSAITSFNRVEELAEDLATDPEE